MPSESTTSESNRDRAPCTLDIIIVGAGFSGLAAAYTLSKAGHKVRVLDQQPHFGSHKTHGLKVGLNLTRALRNWGLTDALATITSPLKSTAFVSLETGEVLNHIFWDDPVMQSTGGEMLAGPLNDVLRLVHDLAVRYGAEILYNNKVVAYESRTTQDKPIVVLDGGRKLEADCVVNAAGLASLANISTEFESMNNWKATGVSMYTTIISGQKMQQDPQLNELLHLQKWQVWMGTNRAVAGYPIKKSTEYVVEILWPDTHAKSWPLDVGIQWIDWSSDAIDFNYNCEPRVDRLLKLVTSLRRIRCLVRKESLSEWVNEAGRIVVIGDAAHPFHPGMISAVPLGVEDANALGTLFSHIPSLSELPAFLIGYQEVRQKASETAWATELEYFHLLQFPPGPERDARDAGMRAIRDRNREPTEDELREHWEKLGFIYAHDASEEAEDWWFKWGRLSARNSDQK